MRKELRAILIQRMSDGRETVTPSERRCGAQNVSGR